MQSEKKDRVLAKEQELGEIHTENVPLTFPLKNRDGTEVRPAASAWISDLEGAIEKHLQENEKYDITTNVTK